MCGIAGKFGSEVVYPNTTFLRSLVERGPDNFSIYSDTNAWLYHSRLSINDLSAAGSQPMVSRKTGNVLLFNGEIYNFRRLIKEYNLQNQLQSSCDSEVLLLLIDELGVHDALAVCEGMYAIAFFDPTRGTICLSRDKYGQKPLFYHVRDRAISFASTPVAVGELLNQVFDYDKTALAEFLAFGFPLQSESLSSDIQSVDAGTILEFQIQADKSIKCVEKNNLPTTPDSVENNLEMSLVHALDEMTSCDHLPAIFLSGGIDSNILYALCEKHFPERISVALTLNFEGIMKEGGKRNTQDQIIPHVELHITDEEYVEIAKEATLTIGEPIGDVAFAATSLLSREAKKYTSVVLSGDGADEIFGGYNRHIALHNKHLLKYIIASNLLKLSDPVLSRIWPDWKNKRSILEALSQNENPTYLDFFQHSQSIGMIRDYKSIAINTVDDLLECDVLYYLKNNILKKTDRASMMHSVEVRLPFLYGEVVGCRAGQELIRGMKGKLPLRRLLKSHGKTTSLAKRGLTPNYARIVDAYLQSEFSLGLEKMSDLLQLTYSEAKLFANVNDQTRWRVALLGV